MEGGFLIDGGMTIWEAIVLGLVQGITEFLPISSTAHIVLAAHVLELESIGLVLEIFLHQASVLAVVIYFRRDIIAVVGGFFRYLRKREKVDQPIFFFTLYLGVATIMTGILGILLTKTMGDELKSFTVMGIGLLFTAAFLLLIEYGIRLGSRTMEKMTWKDAVAVGFAQTLAVLPGISRSGSTLVGALLCGLERETAVRFSFLLAIPVILGSSLLGVKDASMDWVVQTGWVPLLVSFVVCFFASWLGIVWLIGFLRQKRLIYFAAYCAILGLSLLVFAP